MICLNMIVKNEAHVVERMLESVKRVVDRAYILDTGSSDDTVSVMQNWFEEHSIPCYIEIGPFNNFADARSRSIKNCRHWCGNFGWALWIDADDKLTIENMEPISNLHRYTDLDALGIEHRSPNNEIAYPRTSMLNLTRDWIFESVVHEYPALKNGLPSQTAILPGVFIDILSGGDRSKNPARYDNDIAVLEAALNTEKRPDMIARYMFLLGQSHASAGHRQAAIDTFRTRASLAVGRLDQEGCVASMTAAKLIELTAIEQSQATGKQVLPPGEAFALWLNAIECAPHRAEPYYYAARSLRMRNLHASAFPYANHASKLKRDVRDSLSEPEVYRWQNDYELSIAAYHVGEFRLGLKAIKKVLRVAGDIIGDDMREDLNRRAADYQKVING